MGFLQIITFATDRLEEFVAREHEWSESTKGRRTGVGAQVFADRDRRGHYVALDWFDSYESAMVNSHLPETDAFARRASELVTEGPAFLNLEPVTAPWNAGEDELRATLETSTVVDATFADDVDLDILVPHGRMRFTGVADVEAGLRAEAPGRDIERWHVRATADGFAVEYAYRTHGQTDVRPSLAAGIMLVTLRDGLIQRLAMTCAGNWSAETEARVVEETGALGPRVAQPVMEAVR
jgi:hypothetical protein